MSHWSANSKLAAEERERWGWLAREQMTPHVKAWLRDNPPPYLCRYQVRFPNRVNRDWLNVAAALKVAEDGFVDAGLFPNDNNAIVPMGSVEVVLGDKENHGVTLEVVTYAESGSNSLSERT